MKNLLAKFYKSLACRVALALVATGTFANAHDLPQHFPLAPTDWGMIQQDCMGLQNPGSLAINVAVGPSNPMAEIIVSQPDVGNPPVPTVNYGRADYNQLASDELIGPALYDGVDCAKLESYYRNVQSDHFAGQLIEYSRSRTDNVASVAKAATVEEQSPKVDDYEFHKSFFAACSCDFENRQANPSITPQKFTLKRTYIEDHFASEFNSLKPLVLRDLHRDSFVNNPLETLAVAIPSNLVVNEHLAAQMLSEIASYDCIVRSELHSSYYAFQLGEATCSWSKSWFTDTLPAASDLLVKFAQNLEPASKLTPPAPMFVIFQTASGNEVAIPIAQAKSWEHIDDQSLVSPKAEVSQELKELIETANARLQWAGGRLSAAASYMNVWFSDRLARSKADDLR